MNPGTRALHTVRHQRETVSAISVKRVSAIAEMRNWFTAATLNSALARPGHNRAFPTRSQFLSRSARERQV